MGIGGAALSLAQDLSIVLDREESVRNREAAFENLFVTLAETAISFSPLGLAYLWLIEGLKVIGAAHEAGDKRAKAFNYAQTWAEVIAAALVSRKLAPRESTGLAHLDEARKYGRAHALTVLNNLTATQAEEIGAQLLKTYHNESNAKKAIEGELLAQLGFPGFIPKGTESRAFGILRIYINRFLVLESLGID